MSFPLFNWKQLPYDSFDFSCLVNSKDYRGIVSHLLNLLPNNKIYTNDPIFEKFNLVQYDKIDKIDKMDKLDKNGILIVNINLLKGEWSWNTLHNLFMSYRYVIGIINGKVPNYVYTIFRYIFIEKDKCQEKVNDYLIHQSKSLTHELPIGNYIIENFGSSNNFSIYQFYDLNESKTI